MSVLRLSEKLRCHECKLKLSEPFFCKTINSDKFRCSTLICAGCEYCSSCLTGINMHKRYVKQYNSNPASDPHEYQRNHHRGLLKNDYGITIDI